LNLDLVLGVASGCYRGEGEGVSGGTLAGHASLPSTTVPFDVIDEALSTDALSTDGRATDSSRFGGGGGSIDGDSL